MVYKIELLLAMVPIGFTNAILMWYRTYLSGFGLQGVQNVIYYDIKAIKAKYRIIGEFCGN